MNNNTGITMPKTSELRPAVIPAAATWGTMRCKQDSAGAACCALWLLLHRSSLSHSMDAVCISWMAGYSVFANVKGKIAQTNDCERTVKNIKIPGRAELLFRAKRT